MPNHSGLFCHFPVCLTFNLVLPYKIILKALTATLKNILPKLVALQKIAYVKNRFISESERLIFDIIEVADLYN